MIKETGKPTVVEHVGHDASGPIRNIEVHAFPIFDEMSTLKYVVEHHVDITEQRQAEATQQHFRALFESAQGAYLVLKPQDYEIVAASDAYLRATMTTREGILGKRLFEVFPDDSNDPASTGEWNLRASLERVKASRRADVMAVQRYPIRQPVEQDGEFEERWWSPINTAVVGPRGELAYLIHRMEDVTSYVQAKQREGEVATGGQTLDERTHALAEGVVLRGQELQRANEALRKTKNASKPSTATWKISPPLSPMISNLLCGLWPRSPSGSRATMPTSSTKKAVRTSAKWSIASSTWTV